MVTSPLETTGSNGCKVIRAGTGTRETNSPHNYGRGYLCPLPLSSSLVDISIRLIGVIGHGILSRWLATSLRVYTSYIRADDNRYTTHIYARRAIRPWPRNNCPILSIRSATPSLRCRLPPLFQNEGKGAGEGDRKKVTNRYPNLELTLT